MRNLLTFPDALTGEFKGTLKCEEPLRKHTTFHIGGPAQYLCIPHDHSDIIRVVQLTKRLGLPLTLLGNGSNVLVADEGVRGVVLKMKNRGEIMVLTAGRVKVDASVLLSTLQSTLAGHGLSGLEFTFGIPSTVGGALYMNLGSFGREMKDFLVSVTVLTKEGEVKELAREELSFSYRMSDFQTQPWIILDATFQLEPNGSEFIRTAMNQTILKKAATQPLNYPSSGCMFKNPPETYAGRLIEEAGCKGMQVGKIQVSEKHANYFINLGGGEASEAYQLIEQVRDAVWQHCQIKLALEVKLLGDHIPLSLQA